MLGLCCCTGFSWVAAGLGFLGGSDSKESLQCGRPCFNPWVGKILWRRAWQPTPVFFPGESPWTEEPGGLQSMGSKGVGHDWGTKHSTLQLQCRSFSSQWLLLFQSTGSRALRPEFSSVQSLSRVWLFATPWIAARQASLSITNSRSSPKLLSMELVMPSSHLILCHPLLLLPPIPPSIRVFSNESTLRMRWPKFWSFSFSIRPSKEHLGLIFFTMDWLDLLAVQGTLKSLLQHYSSKASILRRSAFFTVQLSHPYMTTGKTGKTIALLD